jgi:hypothetical protein
MKQKLRWVAVGLAILLLVFAVQLYRHSNARGFKRQDFLSVREGMTLAEIEQVLGCPPGDYRTGPTGVDNVPPRSGRDEFGSLRWHFTKEAIWDSDTGRIDIAFDANGKAFSGFFLPTHRVFKDFWVQAVRE